MPPAFCHPLPIEIVIGTIYGMVALLALARRDFSAWRSVVWLGIVVLSGYWMLQTCGRFDTSGRLVSLDQVFVLGLLAGSCRFAAELNRRFDEWNQPNRNRSTRQFGIAGLLWLTTCVAVAILLVKQTTLIDRGVIYWAGIFVFVAIFSLAFSRHPVGLACVAGIFAFGFAVVDARGIQPDELGFGSALIRYAGLLFGMILPRLLLNELSWGLFARLVASKPATDEPTNLTQDFDDSPANIDPFNRAQIKFAQLKFAQANIENANVGSVVPGVTATDQAEPTFRVVC